MILIIETIKYTCMIVCFSALMMAFMTQPRRREALMPISIAAILFIVTGLLEALDRSPKVELPGPLRLIGLICMWSWFHMLNGIMTYSSPTSDLALDMLHPLADAELDGEGVTPPQVS
jgi:hypothetical protein